MHKNHINPAINWNRSGTRREELLIEQPILQKVWVLRKLLFPMDELEAAEFLIDKLKATKTNAEFFDSMRRGWKTGAEPPFPQRERGYRETGSDPALLRFL